MAHNISDHIQFRSRITFVLAATGSAVGLGNIWKFPYMTGENGGGAFVLVYLLCVVAMGIPIMMTETMLGRRGHKNPIASMEALAEEANANPAWKYLGWMGVFAGFIILSYYSVIAGKTMHYVLKILTGLLWDLDNAGAEEAINSLNGSIFSLTFWHSVFMFLTIFILMRGVNEGIEKAVEFLMPGLFLILLVLVGYALTTGSFGEGLSFLFTPDFSKISGSSILAAMGQAFFTLSLGMGAIMVYGSYLPKGISIAKTSAIVALFDTLVALLAGIAIFPIVFANGLEPAAGPDLIFETLPLAFSNMFGGTLVGLLFFLLLIFAALSSSISLIEPAVSYMTENWAFTRKDACIYAGGATWLLGLGTVFSTNIWAEVKFFGTDFFGFIDYLSANLMLPLGGILMAVFAGRIMSSKNSSEGLELAEESDLYKAWLFLVQYVAPAGVGLVLLSGLF
ncbi:MAG: sodium-dependent transporter [Gammaproteobacteria bacterium]